MQDGVRVGAKMKFWDYFPYVLGVLAVHVTGVILLLVGAAGHPAFYGIGLLAYTLGMRHAFDADHIACIDNTVRKLTQQNHNPCGVGFFFSMGHSTVVIIMAIVTALAALWAEHNLTWMQNIGGIIGTVVSGGFLILIGGLNLIILVGIWKVFQQSRKGDYDNAQLEELLDSRGLMNRFFRPLFKFVNRSWQIYPIGFLFGLGFDTASEVALLAISAGAAHGGISFWGVVALPVLFAAGMSLFDTADSLFMTVAYDWAFRTPIRKIYYNLTITGLSVFIALGIGMIELLQVVGQEFDLTGEFWQYLEGIDFADIGYYVVFLFALTWAISYAVWHYGRIEEKFQAGQSHKD